MTGDAALYIASIALLGAKFIANLSEIIGSSIYAIQQSKRLRMMNAHPHSRRLRRRPFVSVVVYTHDDEGTIEKCLSSIRQSRYRKLETIVVDYASSDGTRRIIREYQSLHPKQNIRLVAKRSRPTSWQLLSPPRHIHGELIVYLRGRQTIQSTMITKAVAHFAVHDTDLLLPATHQQPHKSIPCLLQQFATTRTAVLLPLGMWPKTSSCIMRSQTKHTTKDIKSRYADDIIVYEEPEHSIARYLSNKFNAYPAIFTRGFSVRQKAHFLYQCLRILHLTIAITEPIAISYFVYLALAAYSPQPLLLAWILSMTSILFAILIDHTNPLRQRLRLIGLAPAVIGLVILDRLEEMFSIASSASRTKRFAPSATRR